MPIYEYRASGPSHCDRCRTRFEELQRISDPALTECPQCGAPVERLMSASRTPTRSNIDISNKRVAEAGFTRYEKKGKGYYEKTAGQGPQSLLRGDD